MSSRPPVLESATYRVAVPPWDDDMMVTISVENGEIRELFVNSDHTKSFEWISYLTRTVSKRLQAGEHALALATEMKEVYDTEGGYIIPKSQGVRARSVVYHLGWVIEQHYKLLKRESSDE